MKLLCAADLHLGRQPSRLPDDLGGLAEHLTPAESWRRLVRLAIDEGVAAVLLAGDVVEDAYDFFEAYSDLRRGAEELADAGIALLTVAGNHDVEVLPRGPRRRAHRRVAARPRAQAVLRLRRERALVRLPRERLRGGSGRAGPARCLAHRGGRRSPRRRVRAAVTAPLRHRGGGRLGRGGAFGRQRADRRGAQRPRRAPERPRGGRSPGRRREPALGRPAGPPERATSPTQQGGPAGGAALLRRREVLRP